MDETEERERERLLGHRSMPEIAMEKSIFQEAPDKISDERVSNGIPAQVFFNNTIVPAVDSSGATILAEVFPQAMAEHEAALAHRPRKLSPDRFGRESLALSRSPSERGLRDSLSPSSD